jgi:hypothetical protein
MRRCQENFKATTGHRKKDKLEQKKKKAELEFKMKQPTLRRQVGAKGTIQAESAFRSCDHRLMVHICSLIRG